MQSFFGIEIPTAVQYLIALVLILALLVLFAVVLRRITAPRSRAANQAASRTRQPRLAVIDSFDLDRQRQLILLRRDNVEHLIMIGGPTDIVVESGILRNGQRTLAPHGGFQPAMDDSPQMPLDLVVAGAPRPTLGETLPEADAEQAATRADLRQPAPDLRLTERRKSAPPAAGSMPQPAMPQPPIPMSGAQPREPLRNQKREPAPPQPVEKPVERATAITAGSLSAPPGAQQRTSGQPMPRPPESRPPEQPAARSVAPPRPEQRPARSDADAMSAMARELEQALMRPMSGVKQSGPANNLPGSTATGPFPAGHAPSPVPPAASDPAQPLAASPAQPARPRSTAPNAPWDQLSAMTRRPASAPTPPAATPVAPSAAAAIPAAAMPPSSTQSPGAGPSSPYDKPAQSPAPVATPSAPAGSAQAPKDEAQPAAPPSATVAGTQPAAAPPKAGVDPFSVDDIEAEFARLLGRAPPR